MIRLIVGEEIWGGGHREEEAEPEERGEQRTSRPSEALPLGRGEGPEGGSEGGGEGGNEEGRAGRGTPAGGPADVAQVFGAAGDAAVDLRKARQTRCDCLADEDEPNYILPWH